MKKKMEKKMKKKTKKKSSIEEPIELITTPDMFNGDDVGAICIYGDHPPSEHSQEFIGKIYLTRHFKRDSSTAHIEYSLHWRGGEIVLKTRSLKKALDLCKELEECKRRHEG